MQRWKFVHKTDLCTHWCCGSAGRLWRFLQDRTYTPAGPPGPGRTPTSSSHTRYVPEKNRFQLDIGLKKKTHLNTCHTFSFVLSWMHSLFGLTTHSAFEHRARSAEQRGLLALQRSGIRNDHFWRHVKTGQGLLGQSSFQPIGQLLQGPQEPLLIGHLYGVVPRQGQRDACWENWQHLTCWTTVTVNGIKCSDFYFILFYCQ